MVPCSYVPKGFYFFLYLSTLPLELDKSKE